MVAMIIVLVILIVLGIILLIVDGDDLRQMIALVWFLIGVVLCGVIAKGTENIYYKQGQIDAINGIIKYELQTQSDSSTIWVEIKRKE